MKKVILGLMIAIILSTAAFAAESDDIMKSVAFVYMEVDGEGVIFSCFAINQDENGAHTFISAGIIARMAYTTLYIGTEESAEKAEIVYYNPDMDVVIIETENPLPDRQTAVIDFEGSHIHAGTTVYALGLTSQSGTDEAALGTITDPNVYRSNNTRLLQTTCVIDPLNIGGPMVSNGVVIGVNTLNLDESGYAVPLADIYNAMYGNDDTTAETTEPNDNLFKRYRYWFIGAVAAVVVGVVWLLVKRKPQNEPGVLAEVILPDRADEAVPTDETDPSIAETGEAASADLSEPPVRRLKIVGTRGVYAYNGFLVRKPLRFGKDSTQCDVVYPPETESIDAFHCEVVDENGVAVLYDRGSKAGTFLNGERLEPGRAYPLAVKDLFYLGTTDNMFRVD